MNILIKFFGRLRGKEVFFSLQRLDVDIIVVFLGINLDGTMSICCYERMQTCWNYKHVITLSRFHLLFFNSFYLVYKCPSLLHSHWKCLYARFVSTFLKLIECVEKSYKYLKDFIDRQSTI